MCPRFLGRWPKLLCFAALQIERNEGTRANGAMGTSGTEEEHLVNYSGFDDQHLDFATQRQCESQHPPGRDAEPGHHCNPSRVLGLVIQLAWATVVGTKVTQPH